MSDAEEGTGEERSGGGAIKIILIVVAALLLMLVTAFGTMFATGFFDQKPENEDPEVALQELEGELDETDEIVAGPVPKTAEIEQKFLISYYTFEEAFQVNLKNSKKVMQAKLGVSTYFDEETMFQDGDGAQGWIPRHLVGIRASILKVLRNVSAEKIESESGEVEVLEEVRMVINEQLEKHEKTTSAPIEEVYFTELIVQ
jgi:flagellar basal body-associated protein FliL